MKNRYFILILILLFVSNARALDFCVETEEYKKYMTLTPEEQKEVIKPIRCQEVIDESQKKTELKSSIINMTSSFLNSSINDSYYRSPYVTSVKNQYHDGTCWAFSAIAAVESNYMKNGYGTLDLSEAHMAYTLLGGLYSDTQGKTHKYDMDASGGLITYAPSYFFNYQGELTEQELSYSYPKLPTINSSQYREGRHIVSLDTFKIDNVSNSSQVCSNSEITVIKSGILEHGAIQGTMYSDVSNESNLLREGKYYRATAADATSNGGTANHAITIVGWDDTIPASKFGASRDGGWIVKNSWGSNVLDNGYFYISYDDHFICQLIASFSGVSDEVYTNSYKASDVVGTDFYKIDPHTYISTKVTRTKTEPELIEKVSFATSTMGKYKIYLSKNNDLDDIDSWILLGIGSNSNLGIDSVKVQDTYVTDPEFTIIVEYDNSTVGSSQYILNTCAIDSQLDNLTYTTGVNFKSNNLVNWSDMYYSYGGPCAPNIYVYTTEYTDGLSTITAASTSYDHEEATITLNVDNSLSVSNIQLFNSFDDVTDDFDINYDENENKVVINNTNKMSGVFKLKITDSTGEYKMISVKFESLVQITSAGSSYLSKDDKEKLLFATIDKNVGLTVENLTVGIDVVNSSYKIYDSNNSQVTTGKLGTGSKLVLNDKTYLIVIKGDVSGDGAISPIDYVKVRKHLNKANILSGIPLMAADITNDGNVSPLDYVKIRKVLMA